MRRDMINSEVAVLRDLLPLPSSTRQRLSQLQLMALVCVYVRKSNYFDHGEFRIHLPMTAYCTVHTVLYDVRIDWPLLQLYRVTCFSAVGMSLLLLLQTLFLLLPCGLFIPSQERRISFNIIFLQRRMDVSFLFEP